MSPCNDNNNGDKSNYDVYFKNSYRALKKHVEILQRLANFYERL